MPQVITISIDDETYEIIKQMRLNKTNISGVICSLLKEGQKSQKKIIKK